LSFIHSLVDFGGGGGFGLNQELHQDESWLLSVAFDFDAEVTGFFLEDWVVVDDGLAKPHKFPGPLGEALPALAGVLAPLATRFGS
jgi:hypothetical protein